MSARTPAVRVNGKLWSRLGRSSGILALLGMGLCLSVIGLAAGVVTLAAALVLLVVAQAAAVGPPIAKLARRLRVVPAGRSHRVGGPWAVPALSAPTTMDHI